MLSSIMLIVLVTTLLLGAGTAVWVGHSMRQTAADGALPAQTRALEYMARTLAFRVEQQQKPLQSLATVLSGHMHEPREWLEALLLQPASLASQFDEVQLADARGQLLLNLEKIKVGLYRSCWNLHAMRSGVAWRKVSPWSEARCRSRMQACNLNSRMCFRCALVRGGCWACWGQLPRAASLLPLEDEQAGTSGDLFLFDKSGRLLALGSKGQWQLPQDGGDIHTFANEDLAWLRTVQATTLSERRGSQLWSAVTLPWTQWVLVKVSNVKDWVPGMSVRSVWLLVVAVGLTAMALLVVLALVFYPLTELFRKAERAQKRGVMDVADANVYGARWWQRLSAHDWGEAEVLRNALQALGHSRESQAEREQQLQQQLQTLMDYAPVGLVVTQGKKFSE